MDYNLVSSIEACHSFIESEKASGLVDLIYYSHIPTAVIALLFGAYIFFRNRDSLMTKILLVLSLSFAFWTFFDLIVWVNPNSMLIMSSWALLGFFNILIFLFSLYLVAVFPRGEDVSWGKKVLFGLFLVPVILLTPTHFNLEGFDAVNCEAIENGNFVNFYYLLSLILLFLVLWIIGRKWRKSSIKEERRQVAFLGAGITFFLASFISTGFLASFFDNYKFEFYGLFGMTIFLVFLGYIVVKFKAFNIKLIGAQALIVSLIVMIGSMFAFVDTLTQRILVGITLTLSSGMGWLLVKSVKKEVERKEELQKISDALAIANARLQELDNAKSEFISIASHQLRTPLTAIKGYISLILEGSYGSVPVAIQDVLDKVYTVNSRLVRLVEDLLNISRIEAGRIQYSFEPTQIESLVAELVDMFALTAKNRQLELKISLPKKTMPKLTIDPNKIKEVVSNLIDNALKYTKEGGVTASVEQSGKAARIIVSDTGIGFHPEDKEKLFQKFIRSKETTKMVVSGTGLGLYVGKNFIEAHGGKIWAESEGPGKGAKFIIELPFVNPNADKASFASFKESYKK